MSTEYITQLLHPYCQPSRNESALIWELDNSGYRTNSSNAAFQPPHYTVRTDVTALIYAGTDHKLAKKLF